MYRRPGQGSLSGWKWGAKGEEQTGETGALTVKEMRINNEEKSQRRGQEPTELIHPTFHTELNTGLFLKYTCCWIKKQEKINSFVNDTKKENLIVPRCAHSFHVVQKSPNSI